MARTHLTNRNLRFPMNDKNRDLLLAKLNDHDNALDALEAQSALGVAGLRFQAFTGHNGAGACTATGLKVGDKVVGAVNITDGTTATSSFEATITVADQIQQSSASDLSAKKFSLLVQAKS